MAEKDVLLDALEQFRQAEEAASENRAQALDDIKFARLGEQWPDKIKEQRDKEGRPCLTINRLPAFGRRVVNEARQNRPAIQVMPASDQADVHTAFVYTGLVRNIEQTSDADVAYDTGIESAVYGGFGFWRVDVDYSSDSSFDLDLAIRRIVNPFTVYFDPKSEAADSSDWRYAFVTEMCPIEEFKRKYPGAGDHSWQANKDEAWFEENAVRLAEWWKREEIQREIVKLKDGTVLDADVFNKEKELFLSAGLTVTGTRKVPGHKVVQRLMTGIEVLDTKEWAGKYVPIIPVFGDEVNVEGKRYFRSLIRDAKDPQQMLNFWRTAGTELVALAPKVPYIGARGQFTTDAEKWATANRISHSHLEYDMIPGAPPPSRQPLDAGIAAGAMQEAINATEDMKSIIGIFDPALGDDKMQEVSGVAIRRRQRQSDVGVFHFLDNLNRAVRHTGRVLIDLIPHVYTTGRIVRILGEDNQAQNIPLGQETQVPPGFPQQQPNQPPMTKVFDLSVGRYDTVVKAGPSYGTRREEAAEQQIAFMQAVPAMAPLMTDILAENLDWPQSDKLKQRIEQQMANPPPNPEMIKAQAQQQIEQAKAAAAAQVEQAKIQAEGQRAQIQAGVEVEKAKALAQVELAKSAEDNKAKAAIEGAKIQSAEKIKAAELAARREEKLLELSAGILAARQGAMGRNLTNESTLDQSAAGISDTGDIQSVANEIQGVARQAGSGQNVVAPIPKKEPKPKKPRKAKFAKQADGSWLAEELND
jgi:hypothetical protein